MGGLASRQWKQPMWPVLLAQLWGQDPAAKCQAQQFGAAASSTSVALPVVNT